METAEDGRIKRTASVAGGLNAEDFFFLYFAEDDLSDLFRPTDRVDVTARVCTCRLRHVFIARCRSFKCDAPDLHFIHLPPSLCVLFFFIIIIISCVSGSSAWTWCPGRSSAWWIPMR